MTESLSDFLDRLEQQYGKPGTLPVGGPFEMILWENVAYLVNDQRRKNTLDALKKNIGLSADAIASSSPQELKRAIHNAGILPEESITKLSKIAKLVLEEFGGNLNQVLDFPIEKSKKALQLFPGIGEPGAEKILLFCRRLPVLALESNGLRVLLRLGFGEASRSYRATYQSVQRAVHPQLIIDFDWLIRAQQLLRIHGQQLCKRNRPKCDQCVLRTNCVYGRKVITDKHR
jgi:endonuclease III